MHQRSRRAAALLAATAALAGGWAATVSAPAVAAGRPAAGEQRLSAGLLILLGQIVAGTVDTVRVLIAGLGSETVGDLVTAVDAGNRPKLLTAAERNGQLGGALATLTGPELATVVDSLTDAQAAGLLGGADSTQLARLLGALNPAQLAAALARLDAADLTAIVGGLSPAQIGDVLSGGGSASVITGLLGTATGLGGTPGAGQVDGLVAQVDALLAGGVPVQLADLANLLTTVRGLLGTSGLDPARLTSLLSTASGLAGVMPAPAAGPLGELVARLTALLASPPTGGGGGDGGGDGGGGTTPPPTTTPPPPGTGATPGGATAPRPATTTTAIRPVAAGAIAPGAKARSTAYRAALGPLKLNRKRTSMKFTLSCPVTAPEGCLVRLSAKIAGQKAMRTMTLVLRSGRSTPVTVTLSRSTTRRLKAKGGALKVTAQTTSSAPGSATRTLKVKRAPRARTA